MYSAEDLYAESDDLEIIHEQENEDDVEVVEQNVEDAVNEEDGDEDETTKKPVKPKRVIRNPQPKLNVEVLKGPKGLLCLEGYFKNKKYKGEGHEEEYLRTIMKTYEYWCHRLFPKSPFDECLSKLEKLGTNKSVQTYVKKIRMNLVEDEDKKLVSDDEDEIIVDAETQFDLVSEEIVKEPQLTEEQLKRIQMNKEKANRLRLEKLQKAKEKAAMLMDDARQLERSNVDQNVSTQAMSIADEDAEIINGNKVVNNNENQIIVDVEAQFDLVSEHTEVINEPQLTEEQLKRIQINKEKASRLRLEKLQKAKEKAATLMNDTNELKRSNNVDQNITAQVMPVTDEIKMGNFTEQIEDELELTKNISNSSDDITTVGVEDVFMPNHDQEISENINEFLENNELSNDMECN